MPTPPPSPTDEPAHDHPQGRGRMGRRQLLATGLALTGLAACTHGEATSGVTSSTSPTPIAPAGSARPSPSPSPSPADPDLSLSSPGPDIMHGPRTVPAVALTFHASGDPQLASALLEVLDARHTPMTLFLVGSWAASQPDLVRRVVAAGHELGNHTWSHPAMTHLGAAAAYDEIAKGAQVVAGARGGSPGSLFRPSGTPTSNDTIRAAATRAGYARCVSYDVDSLDYTDPSPDAVVHNVLGQVQPGSIVSLHLGHAATLAALPRILDGLAQRSLAPVTVTTLLGAA